jgi:hypothetical protein
MSEFHRYLKVLVESGSLSREDTARATQIIMLGGATPAQIAAMLTAIKMRGETLDEISGCIKFLDTHKNYHYHQEVIYISANKRLEEMIMIGLLLAEKGQKVFIQVPRSRDLNVAQKLGINCELDEKQIINTLNKCNICFAYPNRLTPFRQIIPLRQELGFNMLFDLVERVISPFYSKRRIIETECIEDEEKLIPALRANQILPIVYRYNYEAKSIHFTMPECGSMLNHQAFDHNLDADAKLSVMRRAIAGKDLEMISPIIELAAHVYKIFSISNDVISNLGEINELLGSKKIYERVDGLIEASNLM